MGGALSEKKNNVHRLKKKIVWKKQKPQGADPNDFVEFSTNNRYILTLGEIAKSKHTAHAQTVADQFTDICARVEGVRTYAVSIAKILLVGGEEGAGSCGVSFCLCLFFVLYFFFVFLFRCRVNYISCAQI